MMLLWVAQSSFPSCLASSSRRLHRLHADGVAICALAGMGLRHTKFAQTRSLGEGSKNIIVSRHRVGPDSCSNSVLVSRWSMLSHVNGHLVVQQKAVGTFIHRHGSRHRQLDPLSGLSSKGLFTQSSLARFMLCRGIGKVP